MSKRTCAACREPMRHGTLAFLIDGAELRRAIVCRECAKRGTLIVSSKLAASAATVAQLRHLAKVYEKTGQAGRAEGLRQGADLLEHGGKPFGPADVEQRANGEEVRGEALPKVERPRKPDAVQAVPALTACSRAVLAALVRSGPSSSAYLAIVTGYSVRSGGFTAALAALRAQHLVEGSAQLQATQRGRELASDVPAMDRSSVLDHWCQKVGPCGGAILQNVVTSHPRELDRGELGSLTGYSPTSGGFTGALASLRRLQLLDGLRPTRALLDALAEARP